MQGRFWNYVKQHFAAMLTGVSVLSVFFGIAAGVLGVVQYFETRIDEAVSRSPAWQEHMKKVSLPGISSVAFPKGALIFVDTADGCPAGWTDMAKSDPAHFAGRVIVATGSHESRQTRSYRDIGGSETVTLAIEEIPAHEHGVISNTAWLWIRNSALVKSPINGEFENVEYIKVTKPGDDIEYCRDCPADYVHKTLRTDKVGGEKHNTILTRPHYVMPPFISAFLCKKD